MIQLGNHYLTHRNKFISDEVCSHGMAKDRTINFQESEEYVPLALSRHRVQVGKSRVSEVFAVIDIGERRKFFEW